MLRRGVEEEESGFLANASIRETGTGMLDPDLTKKCFFQAKDFQPTMIIGLAILGEAVIMIICS